MGKTKNIQPAPIPSRFPQTGEELVTLSRAEFWVCAGSKYGGNTLAKHLAFIIRDATGRCTSPLTNENDPGNEKTFPLFIIMKELIFANRNNLIYLLTCM